jgi:hypothetical protein
MQDKEQWIRLCEQAHVEQDPARLLELIREIERLLEEKAERLRRQKSEPQGGGTFRSGR